MKRNILLISLFIVLFSCRPTVLLQSGSTQFKADGEISNLVVIAYTGMLKDHENFERTAVHVFSSAKRDVTSLHQLAGDQDSMYRRNPEKRHELFTANQVDAVVEVRFVSMRQEESSSEDQYPTRREYRIMDDTHYAQLIQEYGKREEKGAVFEDIKVKMDIRLLREVDGKFQVVWSARTESSNPKSNKAIAKACTKKAIQAMKKQDFL